MRKPDCSKCRKKECLKTGRVCKRIEKYLRKNQIHSADWIRPELSSKKRGKGRWREIPFSSLGDVPEDKNPYFDPNI